MEGVREGRKEGEWPGGSWEEGRQGRREEGGGREGVDGSRGVSGHTVTWDGDRLGRPTDSIMITGR